MQWKCKPNELASKINFQKNMIIQESLKKKVLKIFFSKMFKLKGMLYSLLLVASLESWSSSS